MWESGTVEIWTCPDCNRDFGKQGQSHMCQPGLTLEEYFASAQPWEEPIFNIVGAHLRSLGPVIIDPLEIGIMFKRGAMFAQLRTMKKWTALGFSLGHRLVSPRLSRKVVDYNNKFFHVVNLDSAELIDNEILEWLSDSYRFAGGESVGTHPARAISEGADPMVPDDVEDLFASDP